jgi:hypothetical protein
MNPNDHIIKLSDLEAGDILLCVGQDEIAAKVTEITGSKYTHAAICYSADEVADISDRVEKTPACDFINGFSYVAVFRGPNFWMTGRLEVLRSFIDAKVNSDIKYDWRAALSLRDGQRTHQFELFTKLTEHFTNGLSADTHDKTKYICSEIVVATLIAVGMWDEAMAIALKGNTIHPGNMGHNPTFGYIVGFLRADPGTVLPEDDEFARSMTNGMTYGEWVEAAKDLADNPPSTDHKLSQDEIESLLRNFSNNTDDSP